MATRKQSSQLPITVDQAVAELNGAGNVMHLAHQTTLDYASGLAAAKAVRLKVEAARLTRKFGRTSPQAQTAIERLGRQQVFVSAIKGEQQRAAVPIPELNPKGVIAYGRVMRANAPVAGVVVEAMLATPAQDKANVAAAKRTAGRATTDAKGVYQISLDLSEPAVLSLQVKSTKGGRVLAETAESNIKPGTRAYRDIVIADDKGSGGEVPGQTPDEPAPQNSVMPDVTGLQVTSAHAVLEGLGITKITVKKRVADVPSGRVLEQSPAAGKPIKPDSSVTLVVSAGAAVTMPSLVGMTADEAALTLNRLDLSMQPVTDSHAGAKVVAQKPAAGEKVMSGTRVSLKFDKG